MERKKEERKKRKERKRKKGRKKETNKKERKRDWKNDRKKERKKERKKDRKKLRFYPPPQLGLFGKGWWWRGAERSGALNAPFRDKPLPPPPHPPPPPPTPPPLSRKGALRLGRIINTPFRDNRRGVGALNAPLRSVPLTALSRQTP